MLLTLQKITLGIALAAPLGPVSLEMIRRGLQQGFWAAFQVRLGGAFGNLLCLFAASFGLTTLMAHPNLLKVLGILGSGLLFYMGIQSFQKYKKRALKTSYDSEVEKETSTQKGWMLGFYLSIANPVALVFWPGLFATTYAITANPLPSLGQFLLNLCIIGGVLLWGAFLSGVLGFGKRYITPQILKAVDWVAGSIMIAYSLHYLIALFS